MVLNDASVLPAAPNIAVIGSDENCEIISYSSISNNTVTISARGLGDSTAKVWPSGSTVARNHTSLDHNTLKSNIESLNTGKAEADHNHDARYYTETEVDTKLGAKANLASPALTGTPTAPTASSGTNTTQIATTAFVKTELAKEILYFTNQATSVTSAATAEFCRITDSRIDANTVVLNCNFTVPSAITSGVSWTSAAGYISFKGICTSNTCKVEVALGQKGN